MVDDELVLTVMVMLNKIVGYGLSTLYGWCVIIWIVSVGINWIEIWGNCGLVRLGVEGGSISAVLKLIFGDGDVIVGL